MCSVILIGFNPEFFAGEKAATGAALEAGKHAVIFLRSKINPWAKTAWEQWAMPIHCALFALKAYSSLSCLNRQRRQ